MLPTPISIEKRTITGLEKERISVSAILLPPVTPFYLPDRRSCSPLRSATHSYSKITTQRTCRMRTAITQLKRITIMIAPGCQSILPPR